MRKNKKYSELFPFSLNSLNQPLTSLGEHHHHQKFLVQWKPPQLSIKQKENGIISFQMDTDTQVNPTPQCPLCRSNVDNTVLVGSWNVVLWSRNFLLNTMLDLDMIIDKLEANKPISGQKTVYEWLASPPSFRCPQLIVLDQSDSTKFELAYRVANADQKSKSIIGSLDRSVDGTYLWQLAPTISLQVCIALVPSFNNQLGNNNRSSDFLVLNQIDSWPRCENFVVLMRRLDPLDVADVREYLEQQKVEGVFNKLEKAICDRIH
uniref:Uncharacterized protein n=1 Tax=Ditylenchus dipsaci TaxID=166011 RepID=A0A915D6B4_9BILA